MVAAGDPACPVHNIKKGEYIMGKTTFKITKTIEEEYELKIGDYIKYTLSQSGVHEKVKLLIFLIKVDGVLLMMNV